MHAKPNAPAQGTAALMSTSFKLAVPDYPSLPRWPELQQAVNIHIKQEIHVKRRALNLPVQLMRKCGMSPEKGVNVAVHKGKALVWGGAAGGPYRSDEESKNFILHTRFLGGVHLSEQLAIVEGPDYLIITTRNEAFSLAGEAPAQLHAPWERISRNAVPALDQVLDASSVEIHAWHDFSIGASNKMRKSAVASVSGTIWWKAGFRVGDAVRFTRYKNATVVEKCSVADKHSVITSSRANGLPRHYIGANLFKEIFTSPRLRAVATADKLILTLPNSDLGARCVTAPKPESSKQIPPQPLDDNSPLEAADLNMFTWKDYSITGRHATIDESLFALAGMQSGTPIRFIRYPNALVVESCDKEDMELELKPLRIPAFRRIGFSGTGMAVHSALRAVATRGQLVFTPPKSELGIRCGQAVPWPDDIEKQIAMLESLRGEASQTDGSLAQTIAVTTELAIARLRKKLPKPKRVKAPAKVKVAVPQRNKAQVVHSLKVAPQNAPEKSTGGLPQFVHKDVALVTHDYAVKNGAVVKLFGSIWTVAGFACEQPARLVQYADALVIEPCSEHEMQFRVITTAANYPCRYISIEGTVLDGAKFVRVTALHGRLVLMEGDGSLAGHLGAQQQGAVDTTEYEVPTGRRLQIQGRWLSQYGFLPGAHFVVTKFKNTVRVSLTEFGKSMVTEHSPGSSKLYVPATAFSAWGKKKIQVRARSGQLILVAA